jgi:hypothetical protein
MEPVEHYVELSGGEGEVVEEAEDRGLAGNDGGAEEVVAIPNANDLVAGIAAQLESIRDNDRDEVELRCVPTSFSALSSLGRCSCRLLRDWRWASWSDR